MTLVVVLASVALAAVAAAGVARPFGRRAAILEEAADPLEDERDSLLRALRELERDRVAGLLSEEDHAVLRAETEARAVAVLRAIEARDRSGELAAGLKELRETSEPSGDPRSWSRRALPALLVAAAVAAVAVPLLSSAVRDRAPRESITGTQASDPLAFFEERVREHPNDLAARLDLADRYFAVGRVQQAAAQYGAALRIDRDNAEARANLGFLLALAGEPESGLAQVERALRAEPRFPEALYFKGIILLEGLDRPGEAAEAFRAYLDAAPFGARRDEVRRLLREAEAAGQPREGARSAGQPPEGERAPG